ncbi:hypothetical protein DNTS_026423 [Danionella cerebrum]|uniref:Glutathione peroxidase n=1 Tax=Danionella cerebrum TaxID=2873325 RepID=A0A553RKV6_9TELE|nr:hypothetical protein DNTS_026423 [Danionella translucida]
MHAKYAERGLRILAFPSNQFGRQEPGTNAQIKGFAKSYNAEFDMFGKIDVNGDSAHPLWKWLKEQPNGKGFFGKWWRRIFRSIFRKLPDVFRRFPLISQQLSVRGASHGLMMVCFETRVVEKTDLMCLACTIPEGIMYAQLQSGLEKLLVLCF